MGSLPQIITVMSKYLPIMSLSMVRVGARGAGAKKVKTAISTKRREDCPKITVISD